MSRNVRHPDGVELADPADIPLDVLFHHNVPPLVSASFESAYRIAVLRATRLL